jgi:hypothetical protein
MVVAIPKWMHFSKATSAPKSERMNDIYEGYLWRVWQFCVVRQGIERWRQILK